MYRTSPSTGSVIQPSPVNTTTTTTNDRMLTSSPGDAVGTGSNTLRPSSSTGAQLTDVSRSSISTLRPAHRRVSVLHLHSAPSSPTCRGAPSPPNAQLTDVSWSYISTRRPGHRRVAVLHLHPAPSSPTCRGPPSPPSTARVASARRCCRRCRSAGRRWRRPAAACSSSPSRSSSSASSSRRSASPAARRRRPARCWRCRSPGRRVWRPRASCGRSAPPSRASGGPSGSGDSAPWSCERESSSTRSPWTCSRSRRCRLASFETRHSGVSCSSSYVNRARWTPGQQFTPLSPLGILRFPAFQRLTTRPTDGVGEAGTGLGPRGLGALRSIQKLLVYNLCFAKYT